MDSLDYYEDCTQCPRDCKVNRKKRSGFCGEGATPRAALASLHFGEEPPIAGQNGSGTIFFSGCNLRCTFCQNYQISQEGVGREIKEKDFIEICLTLQSMGANNINLVTGSHQIPAIAHYIEKAKDAGVKIPFCWNSNGYEKVEMLEHLKPLVDIWLPDLKTLDSDFSRAVFFTPDYPLVATRAIKWMVENFPIITNITNASSPVTNENKKDSPTEEVLKKGVIVRHLFMPGRFSDTARVLKWLKDNVASRAYISIMTQYTPIKRGEKIDKSGQFDDRLTNEEEAGDLRDMLEIYDFPRAFYQELSADTSWLPNFNNRDTFPNKLSKTVWHWKDGE